MAIPTRGGRGPPCPLGKNAYADNLSEEAQRPLNEAIREAHH